MQRIIDQGSIGQGVQECETGDEGPAHKAQHGTARRSVASRGIGPLDALLRPEHLADPCGDGRAVLFERGEGALHVLIDRLLELPAQLVYRIGYLAVLATCSRVTHRT